jgi:solute carrier family 25 protein 44
MVFYCDVVEETMSGAAVVVVVVEEVRRLPTKVNREMLDKLRFFVLDATLFSGVSAVLHLSMVVKTHLQVVPPPQRCQRALPWVLRVAGWHRATALCMAALEATKSSSESVVVRLVAGIFARSTVALAVAGISLVVACTSHADLVDAISQRLMIQTTAKCRYGSGADTFRKIVLTDNISGLYEKLSLRRAGSWR